MWDVVVIGGGAAGLSAALMLGRARRRVLVIDAGEPRNRFAEHMHGVLGHDGLSPWELVRRGREEVAGYGVNLRSGTVVAVHSDDDGCRVVLGDGEELGARRVVVTTGLTDELPTIDGLGERWGKEVFQCPYCHGYEVRDRRIGVIATSEQSLHHVQLLRQWSEQITFFSHLAGDLTPQTQNRLEARGINIEPAPVHKLIVDDDDKLTGLELQDRRRIDVDAIAVAGKWVANDGFLSGLELAIDQGPFGTFITADPTGRTSNPRIFVAGNVKNPGGSVPAALAEGSMAGAMANMDLVEEDFDRAEANHETEQQEEA